MHTVDVIKNSGFRNVITAILFYDENGVTVATFSVITSGTGDPFGDFLRTIFFDGCTRGKPSKREPWIEE